jgi:hypothetical protein
VSWAQRCASGSSQPRSSAASASSQANPYGTLERGASGHCRYATSAAMACRLQARERSAVRARPAACRGEVAASRASSQWRARTSASRSTIEQPGSVRVAGAHRRRPASCARSCSGIPCARSAREVGEALRRRLRQSRRAASGVVRPDGRKRSNGHPRDALPN